MPQPIYISVLQQTFHVKWDILKLRRFCNISGMIVNIWRSFCPWSPLSNETSMYQVNGIQGLWYCRVHRFIFCSEGSAIEEAFILRRGGGGGGNWIKNKRIGPLG